MEEKEIDMTGTTEDKDLKVEEKQKLDNEGGSEADKLKIELDEKTKAADEYLNRLMMLQADFENYKKRVAKEREDMYSFALESIVGGILPVVDNLERALGSLKSEDLDSKYADGIEMVFKQLIGVLEKNGVKEIESESCNFDPNLHHAVMQCEAEDDDENKIKMVLQKGYMLGTKVIRPSLVSVAVKN